MKNSISENSIYIESDEEDEEKDLNKGGDDGHDSDSSNYSNENPPQRKPSSYNISWPQSYRQSIDLYSSVPSPNIGFLGTPSLSRLSSSFLSTSLTRRHTPEALPSVTKPLIQPIEDEQHRRSSHTLLPPLPRRSSSLKKGSKVSHEGPISSHCSFGQAVLNGINCLCGVGILSTPYAAQQGGWVGLSVLFIFALISFYTGMLLRSCLDSEPGIETYPDIGQAAFGTTGRIAISIVLYVELYACCIEYIILEGDNLSSLFPNAYLNLGGIELNSHTLFALIATLAVLPTVWLRDLSVLSYISAGGVIASILVVVCLFWVGVEDVGFHSKGTTINLTTFPVAVGLYGYCYSGHAVFPNIYTSMANPNQFPAVLLACFGICTLLYAGSAVMGYTMFGEAILSQFTLNMPQDLVASKIAVWTTVVNPFTKYALTISPVAMSLEELIPSDHAKSYLYSIFIRTGLVVSTLIIGLSVPFFGLLMSLIGSLLTMLVTLILPCACFLRILKGKVTQLQTVLCITIITVGSVSAVFGTYSALSEIVKSLSG
ncbi:PREDICTED: vacuolar amino acid transporter 1-like [Lupinus angustifolius]|uniref:vacuolar amino acid transporter 1-like n=1 Tax=Lupinus angustifolius TaxID=3871 RepID=UPI00092EB71F|nr:PREDICTED: vacuolar amino acid transporter 1-like [Lupinus angustifolius]XP_019433818.1 PREDICTED: vacuolar amino acid transporter 1-like [Lupinus angustifolius]XP_019433819.1 PREDICTED: vacuolar amino acid transporter 1-like [Lupinus angustifolius]XP_019433820.1 PREDICTED: vacuolar amino acid transporter 1-like [Lupinus angustifolius]